MKHPKPSSRKVPEQSGLFQCFSAGLIGGGATSAGNELIRSVQIRGAKGGVDPTAKIAEVEKKKVGVVALFKYSMTNEHWLMLVGIVMAAVAGLSMPVWLLLLVESLETFKQIGAIVAARDPPMY